VTLLFVKTPTTREARVRLIKTPVSLQDLRRRIYKSVSVALFAAAHFIEGITVGVSAGIIGGSYLA
jgi:hypothetical protein